MKKTTTFSLVTIIFVAAFATSVFAHSGQSAVSPPFDPNNLSSSNSTLVGSSSPLPPLIIPNINENGIESAPTMPPFDPAKATPVNMTQVRADMAANPISDENHSGPLLQP
jgi:hypothetical protein